MKNRLSGSGDEVLLQTASLPLHYYKKLLDAAADVMCIFDEEGVMRYVNKASVTLWGYHPEEMIGFSFKNFMVTEDISKTDAYVAQSPDINPDSNFINRYYKKDGSVINVHWSGTWNEKERLFFCIAKDGTGIKEIEARLEKTQRLAKVAGFEFDLKKQMYTYTSDTLFSIFGIDKNLYPVFTRKMFWESIHPDDLQLVKESTLLPAYHNRPKITYRIVRPDGKIVYIKRIREVIKDENGNPVKTIGTLQDITERIESEHALVQSEQRMKALVENGSDLISIIDTSGNYIYVADSVKKILGYEADFFIGKNAFSFIHPDDQQMSLNCLADATAKKFVTLMPFRFQNAAGDWRWIESKIANLTDDPAINGIIINSRDITEQKRHEDKIRELSLIAEKTNQAILLADSQCRISWVNQSFTELSEYTLEDVAGKKTEDLFTSAFVKKEENLHLQNQLLEKGVVIREMPCVSKSGRNYWMELHIQPLQNDAGDVQQYLAIGKDITERKKIDAQLALSQQKFKSLVQNGSDLIVIVDEKGIFKYVSDNIISILQYNPESLIGKNAFDFVHKEDLLLLQSELQKVQMDGHLSKGVEHRFLTASGEWIWLESKGTNHIMNESVEGIIINARNINDRVKLQKKLNKELRNRHKEVTSAVINAQEQERSQLGLELHDNVNQVLTTVKLYNEMFLSGFEQDKELIKKSTLYLQECINEIRSISKRLSAPTLGHISLHDSIRELVESLAVTRQVEILFRPYHIEQLCISQELHLTIYRIVQEGLNNIIKYAEAKTAIIAIRHWKETLSVTIYDDGKGFDINLKSSGIGITNMRTRAENLNGTFELTSTPGQGCIIKMVFALSA